ncbi:MAG TPA: isoprenylcysteine carboxylmethyltransferase family protein [Devosia sp.]|nr:isoprenylcysteine carboxylmethyltransferase family protein [Devosia sp.]
MSFLELKIPPPLVVVIVAVVMWGVSLVTPHLDTLVDIRFYSAGAFAVGGIALMGISFIGFAKAKTTVNPISPDKASALVTTGIYGVSRNPIYVADMLFLLAWGFYLANPLSLVLAFAFIPYINRFQIMPEERALQELFGEEFAAYKKKVRRWL